MRIWRTIFAFALVTLVSAGAAHAALHPGDRVQISVYNHPELATQATVDAMGRVSMPLAGAVAATGASERELAARIQNRLQYFMRYPAVDVVLLSQSPEIYVVGGPGGTIQYRPGQTLMSALADVQTQCRCSLGDSAEDTSRVRIIRNGVQLGPYNTDTMQSSGEPGPPVLPGDRIAFENRAIAVSVKGAVKNPGTAYLSAGQPLSTAIDQLGGLTANASFGQILLQRDGVVTQIADGSPEFSAPAHAGDSLNIPSQEHIQVIGAVNGGGEIVLKQDFTLLSAIYFAGGPNRWADLRNIMVRHRGETHAYDMTHMEHGNLAVNPALEDGDVVYVPEGHKIDWRGFFQALTWGRWLLPQGHL